MERKPLKEKPQGFEVAKMRKRGEFNCYYDCGAIFNDQKLAMDHPNCPGKLKNNREIKEAYELMGQEAPEEYTEGTVDRWEKPGILSVEEKKSVRKEMQDDDGVPRDHDNTKQTKLKHEISIGPSKTQEPESDWFLKNWISQTQLKKNPT